MVKTLRFGLMMLLMAVTTSMFAQATPENPEDRTSLIANPSFDGGSSSGWSVTASGIQNNKGFGGYAWEFWNGNASSMQFDINQTLASLPAGTYELAAELANSWNDDTSNQANEGRAYLYALTSSEVEYSVAVQPQNEACGDRRDIYKVYFSVAEGDASVKIGWKTVGTQAARWFVCDNFKLTYFGVCTFDEAKLGGFVKQLKDTRAEAASYAENEYVVYAIQTQIADAIAVADAELLNTEQTEASLQAAIDGLNAAIKAAKLSISNNDAIVAHYDVLKSTNVYTTEAYETFKAAADAYLASWEAGTLTESVVNPNAVQGWRSANAYDDFLLSAWTIGGAQCKDFDTALYINTWSTEGGTDGSNFTVPFFEYWTGDAQSLGANALTATVKALLPGKQYTATAWVRVRVKNGATDAPKGITLKVGDGEAVDVCTGTQVGGSQFYLAEFTATGAADAEGNLTITFDVAADNNISWLSFKNVNYTKVVEYANVTADPADGSQVKAPVKSINVTFTDAALIQVNAENSAYVQLTNEVDGTTGVMPMVRLTANGNVLTVENVSMMGAAPIFDKEGVYTIVIPEGKVLAGADEASLAPAGAVKLTYTVLAPDPVKEITFVATPESGSVVDALPFIEIEFPGWEYADINPNLMMPMAVGITKDGVNGAPLTTAIIEFGSKNNSMKVNTNLTEPGEYVISIFPNVFAVGDEIAETPYTKPIMLNYTIAEALETVITYPGEGETFTLGDYDDLSLWFSTYPSGSLNAENTDPVTITDAEGNVSNLDVKFNAVSVEQGFVYAMVMADGSTPFAEAGTFTIEIPAGKFFVTDSASVTNPSKKIKVTYTAEAPLEKAIVADPVNGSTVESLESVTITYQGYSDLTVDYNGDANSEVRNIVIKKDGVVVKESDFYFNIDEVNFSNEFKINFGTTYTETGIYTIEIPDGKFCEWFGEGAPGITLVYGIGVDAGINGVVVGDVVKTEYFGLNGAALNAPVKGINIVKQTLTNGTVVTSKVLVK